MELDYFNEAANAEEFALRHAFLPFVTSPGWIPELMGPTESSRVLALKLGTSWEGSRTVPGRIGGMVNCVGTCWNYGNGLCSKEIHGDSKGGQLFALLK